jgi:hypothetical protein
MASNSLDGKFKKCPGCDRIKPVLQFRKNRSRPDGLSFYCKSCFAEKDKKGYRRRRLAQGKTLREHPEVPDGYKYCSSCKQIKPHSEWHRARYQAGGLAPYCKECKKVKGSESYFKRKYGLTREQVEAMSASQGGKCLICREGRAEHVDHDHATGEVRGMLCFSCNAAIGHLKEKPDVMTRAIRYVQGLTDDEQPVTPAIRPVVVEIYRFGLQAPVFELAPHYAHG